MFNKNLLIFIICCSCILSYVDSSAIQPPPSGTPSFPTSSIFETVVEYSRHYRLDLDIPVDEDIERRGHILEQLCEILPYYLGNLSESVRVFLEDALQHDVAKYTIIDAASTEIGGKSKDKVFLIKDETNTLCYIIKAFKNPKELTSKFLPEISALDFLIQLNLPGVAPIYPLAFALCEDQDTPFGLLLEIAATGQRVDQYVYELANPMLNEDQRFAHQITAQQAFSRMGETLAELQKIKSSEPGVLPSSRQIKWQKKCEDIAHHPFIMQELSARLNSDDFFNYLDEIFQKALRIPLFYTYQHGDFHLGNVLYDNEKDLFFIIDVAKLHDSFDKNGVPLGCELVDLFRPEKSLSSKALGLLTDQEREGLLHAYYQAYEGIAGASIHPDLVRYYKTYTKLGRLTTYSRYITETDPIKRAQQELIFNQTLNDFTQKVYALKY